MTHVLVKCLCLAITPCAFAAFAASSAAAPVALFLDFERSPASQVVSAMESEVERVLAPSGLGFEWRLLSEPRSGKDFRAVAVIHVAGVCAVPPPTSSRDGGVSANDGVSLASTPVADGRVLPFTDLQCARIGQYISPLLAGASDAVREQVLGRAMGRVLAHELYHIFTRSRKHADGGIAREFHRRQELAEDRFNFRESENEMFRAFKARIDTVPGSGSEPVDSETADDSVAAAGR